MHADLTPIIEQLATLDKASLLRVKYEVQAALTRVLPKGVSAKYRVPATETSPAYYYEQRKARCGRKGCMQCSTGQGHGPYWFRLHFQENPAGGRRTRKCKYIGRILPEDVLAQINAATKDKGIEDPVRVEHSVQVGGNKLGHRAFRKVARSMATTRSTSSG